MVLDLGSWSWQVGAACRGHDPELFFPIGTTGPAVPQAEAAKLVCRGCGVRVECLTVAMSGRFDGVWGGTTVEERESLRRRRRRVK